MPAVITHHLFGEDALKRLPDGIVTDAQDETAFILGNQGPDPLFFRVRSLQMSAAHELGHRMHASHMSRAFGALRDGVSRLPERDATLGRAFALGLLAHYALDRTAHPFVYAQQWGIQAADPELANASSEVHAVIESDLDVFMLQLKRNGATVADYPPCEEIVTSDRINRVAGNPPCEEIVTSDRINRVAGTLMSYVAYAAFDITLGGQEYGGSVADMQLAYKLIEPAGTARSEGISMIESVVRPHSLLGALAHRVTTQVPAGAANLTHHPWENPFTNEPSTEDFDQVFSRALDAYERMAQLFVSGSGMPNITGRVNYSGRPLSATEECSEED